MSRRDARQTPDKARAFERFREHLRDKGLKMTRERRRILDAILDVEGHFRPEELLLRFRDGDVQVSRATIYRTLDLLVGTGLVIRETFHSSGAHYERAHTVEGHAHHDHLYCTECGAIFEFHNEEIERLQDEVCRQFGFEARSHTHKIRGHCRQCRRQSASA